MKMDDKVSTEIIFWKSYILVSITISFTAFRADFQNSVILCKYIGSEQMCSFKACILNFWK